MFFPNVLPFVSDLRNFSHTKAWSRACSTNLTLCNARLDCGFWSCILFWVIFFIVYFNYVEENLKLMRLFDTVLWWLVEYLRIKLINRNGYIGDHSSLKKNKNRKGAIRN